MDLKSASDIAVHLCYTLQPHTSKLHIAGSIRRKKSQVKDIEIVCLPNKTSVTASDLFGSAETTHQITNDFSECVYSLGKILKGKPSGRYCQIELPQGINLDLFIPQENDFIRQYVIRTGSANYVARVIAKGWRNKGWVGTEDGLRKESECGQTKAKTWQCNKDTPTLPPIFESEQEFFAFLGVNYLLPEKRFL